MAGSKEGIEVGAGVGSRPSARRPPPPGAPLPAASVAPRRVPRPGLLVSAGLSRPRLPSIRSMEDDLPPSAIGHHAPRPAVPRVRHGRYLLAEYRHRPLVAC